MVEGLIEEQDTAQAKRLINSNDLNAKYLKSATENSKTKLRRIVDAVDLLCLLQTQISHQTQKRLQLDWPDLYILAMNNQLLHSDILAELINAMKRATGARMVQVVRQIVSKTKENNLGRPLKELETLIHEANDVESLKSAYSMEKSNLRTTIVAQKVELSKHSAQMSPLEASYTKLVDRIIRSLMETFVSSLSDPKHIFLHEAFVYDGKHQFSEAFTPRPRHAVERALSSPSDYLACECCTRTGEGLSALQPATALLYQLYLESSSQVNAADLWSAFWTIIRPEENEEQQVDQGEALYVRPYAF